MLIVKLLFIFSISVIGILNMSFLGSRHIIKDPEFFSYSKKLEYDSVYFLNKSTESFFQEIDKVLEDSTVSKSIKVFFKGENVVILKMGCVSSTHYVGCTHYSYAYFLFCYKNETVFMDEYENSKINQKELKRALSKEQGLDKSRRTELEKELDSQVSQNQYYEKTKGYSW